MIVSSSSSSSSCFSASRATVTAATVFVILVCSFFVSLQLPLDANSFSSSSLCSPSTLSCPVCNDATSITYPTGPPISTPEVCPTVPPSYPPPCQPSIPPLPSSPQPSQSLSSSSPTDEEDFLPTTLTFDSSLSFDAPVDSCFSSSSSSSSSSSASFLSFPEPIDFRKRFGFVGQTDPTHVFFTPLSDPTQSKSEFVSPSSSSSSSSPSTSSLSSSDVLAVPIDVVSTVRVSFVVHVDDLAGVNLAPFVNESARDAVIYVWFGGGLEYATAAQRVDVLSSTNLRRDIDDVLLNRQPQLKVEVDIQFRLMDCATYDMFIVLGIKKQVFNLVQVGQPLKVQPRHPTNTNTDSNSAASEQQCQVDTLPEDECSGWLSSHHDGRWVSCRRMNLNRSHPRLANCLHDGWVYVPRSCYYQVYDTVRLASAPIWVVYFGTSVIRGNLLTAIDLVLRDRAVNLTVSDFWKCWNWMDAQIDNLRLSYLDFRWFNWMFFEDNNVQQTSTLQHDYIPAARQFLQLLTSPGGLFNQGRQPDILVFECEWPAQYAYRVDQVRSWLHPSYRGRILISPQKINFFRPFNSWMPTYDDIATHLRARPGTGMELVSDYASIHVVMSGEMHGAAQHLHERCPLSDRTPSRSVCGLANEMSFHMLFNTIFKRRPIQWQATPRLNALLTHIDSNKTSQSQRAQRSDCHFLFNSNAEAELRARQINFCLQCPRNLVPFSMPWELHPVCHEYIPTELMHWI